MYLLLRLLRRRVVDSRRDGMGGDAVSVPSLIHCRQKIEYLMSYDRDSKVRIYPFSRQIEGDEAIIGRAETGVFLAVPSAALEVLDALAAGKTVGEAQDLFYEQHGETPDLEDLLEILNAKGFLRNDASLPSSSVPSPLPIKQRRSHFSSISAEMARMVFSRGMAIAVVPLLIVAVVLVLRDPGLLPDRFALFFKDDRTLKTLGVALFGYSSLFLHEMGHLVAARARGVGATLGIGHRLWFLVAETDLTGLWSLPRKERYLPLLAGTLVDLVSMSMLVVVLALNREQRLTLGSWSLQILNALFFVYFLRVVWQFYLFVRTDFYYVITTALGCKNLLGDTEAFLRNLLARLLRRGLRQDQSHLPRWERRYIHAYAVIWVLGRALSFSILIFVSIPVTLRYLASIGPTLRAGYSASPHAFVDSIGWLMLSFSPLVLGIMLWIRSLTRSWRTA